MYVHVCPNGFMIEIYGFTHSLRTSLACAAHDAIAVEDSEDRRRRQNESR